MSGTHASPTQHAPASHWSAPAAEKVQSNPVAMSSEGLMEAGKIYRDNCAGCHGAEGLGDGPVAKDLDGAPANIFAMAQSHSDGDLRWKIAQGRGEMPGWQDVLSDTQIWSLVHYIKTLPAFHVADRPEHR
ncbi:MAG: cytochrome c [Alphaproteobacteria bacterium]|nr:cytochrome c [Alphaproteobacteria bacterium]